MDQTITGYDVGPLLYCPANAHCNIVDWLRAGRVAPPFSLAFCLEDTVEEGAVAEAEQTLCRTLTRLKDASAQEAFYMPPVFIRVRSPRQLRALASACAAAFPGLVTGFILPKFFVANAGGYIAAIQAVREEAGRFYYMPILEDPAMIDLRYRHRRLYQLRDALEAVSDRILNIRTGGNDLSNAFGLRRQVHDTIYDLRPVADLLADIAAVFAGQYTVSGPVWEYYAGSGWEEGLRRETALDALCGFTGKTVIHPNQIPVVNDCLRVSAADYQDARRILDWAPGSPCLVAASAEGTRMNEYNTHLRWAGRTLRLAQVYGVRDSTGPAGRQQPCRQS